MTIERRTHGPLAVLAMCLICALLGYGAFVGVVREVETSVAKQQQGASHER